MLKISPSSSCLALLIGLAPFAMASELHVSKTTDSSDGVCNADCSLREAIQFANAQPGAHHILLPSGTYLLSGLASGASEPGDGLPVTGDITIMGSGSGKTLVDADHKSRLFTVSDSGRLTLEKLSLVNGKSPTRGGALLNHGVTSLTHVSLRNNRVMTPRVMADQEKNDVGWGGAIANFGDLAVQSSTFENNAAMGFSAPAARGGAIFNAAQLIVRNTTFTANSAAIEEEGWGGALYNQGTADIARSAFVRNQLPGWGYGAAILNLGTLQLANSTISGNSTFEGHGTLVNGPDTGWLSHFPITEPGQVQAQLVNVTLTNNKAGFGGFVNYASASIRNSLIAGNYYELESDVLPSSNCRNKGTLDTRGLLLGTSKNDKTCEADMLLDDALTFTQVLAPLDMPTGTPPIHPLLEGSPAIDAGVGTCSKTDQRKVARPQDGNGDGVAGCDLGAFEVAAP